MSQHPNPPLSRHANSAINEYLLFNEAPWNCWHLRLPWAENAQSQPFLPSTSPTGWSTVSNGSSVLAEDEQSVRVDLLALTAAMSIHDSFPETSGSFGHHHEDFGQVFAGSSATDVTDRLGTSSRDAGHATRSKAAPSAKSFGEICESGETISAAAPQVRYFGCPFSKYDPARYELVTNACTHRPGWEELKRVLEHLRKVHSKKNRCEKCRTQYPKQIDFEKHVLKKDCTKVEETDPKYPELMTAEQEAIFDKVFDAMPYEDKWRAYYRFLFPNASNHHSIDPYYDYTTLTHLLEPASLTSQKRPASPFSKLEDSPQYKRKSRGVSSTIPQADSVINHSVGSPDYPPPMLAHQVHQDPIYQPIGTNEFTDIASPPIDIDSAYGSRDGIIPSPSNLHAPRMLPSAPPRLNRGDSGIASSSNASVLTGPKTTQSRSGSAAQDVSNLIPQPYFHPFILDPTILDPNLPSHMIPPEEQSHLGFELDPNIMFGSFDHHDQKSA